MHDTRIDETPALRVRAHLDLFATGRWSITPAAIHVLAHRGVDPASVIWRHRTGDWGDVDLHQALANSDAVDHGGPIQSAYQFGCDTVRIETAADRTETFVSSS